IEQMKNIFTPAGEEIVEAEHFIALAEQPLAKVRPDESRTTCNQDPHNLFITNLCKLCTASSHRKIPEIKHVHLRLSKTINRFLRRADDRLILVERRIQNHRHTRQRVEI